MSDHVRCPACGTADAADDAYRGACGSQLTQGTAPPIPALSTIDVLGEACLALRVVGWDDGDERAWVFVDIERARPSWTRVR
jgi:hypothetical protein